MKPARRTLRPTSEIGVEIPDHGLQSTTEDDAVVAMGRTIRQARGDRTIEDLSASAGVSPGLVSQVERGIGNPSLKSLHKIAKALNLRLGDLLEGGDVERRRLVRHDQRRTLGVEGLTYELLTPDLNGQLEVLLTSLPAGFDNERHPFSHQGEECILLVEGQVQVTVGGDDYLLDPGDAITYDAAQPHWYRNDSGGPARVLGVVTPPSF